MIIESCVLMTKLLYSQARYDEAIKYLNTSALSSILNEHLSKLAQSQQSSNQYLPKTENARQLQLFAEAHALKGLCFEIKKANYFQANTNKLTIDELRQEDQEITDSFEMSSLLVIQHSLLMHQIVNNLPTPNSAQSGNQNAASSSVNSSAINSSGNTESSTATIANLNINALNNNDENLDLINPLYEIALQKAPLLYIKRG